MGTLCTEAAREEGRELLQTRLSVTRYERS